MDPLQIAFRQALRFALDYHTGQTRKGTSVPYIVHPVAVGETLAHHYPDNLELVVAGLLHDVVEDTDATLEQVERRFGPTVTALVDAVTKPEDLPDLPEDPVLRWQVKRDAQLEKLRASENDDAFRLKAADALANLHSLARDALDPNVGSGVWKRFKGTREQTLGYYERVRQMIEERLTGSEDAPLLRELERAAHAVSDEGASSGGR